MEKDRERKLVFLRSCDTNLGVRPGYKVKEYHAARDKLQCMFYKSGGNDPISDHVPPSLPPSLPGSIAGAVFWAGRSAHPLRAATAATTSPSGTTAPTREAWRTWCSRKCGTGPPSASCFTKNHTRRLTPCSSLAPLLPLAATQLLCEPSMSHLFGSWLAT